MYKPCVRVKLPSILYSLFYGKAQIYYFQASSNINLNSVKVTENRYFVALNSWWQMCSRGAVGRKSGWKMWGGEGA